MDFKYKLLLVLTHLWHGAKRSSDKVVLKEIAEWVIFIIVNV